MKTVEEAMPASETGTNALGEFKGKHVLVTGGTKGAGKAIAARFLQGGATVAITARSAPPETTAAHFIQADVSTPEGTAHVIGEILSRFKSVDLIIHHGTHHLNRHKRPCSTVAQHSKISAQKAQNHF